MSSSIFPATLLGRVITIFVAAGLAVIGLFFVAFALIAAATLAAIVGFRIWWVARKLRAQPDADVIEGSYSVESRPVLPASTEETVETAAPRPK